MNSFRSRDQARTTYDSLSRWYDFLSGPAEGRTRQQAINLLDVQAEDRILEIGCGTGSSAVEVGKKVIPGGYIFALDLSFQMLKVAQKRLKHQELNNSIGLINGDAVTLPLLSSSVSGILMSFTLELFEAGEMLEVLSECQRVLRPGGKLCALSMSTWQPQAPLLKPYEWLHAHFPAWIDCRPILLCQTLVQHGFSVIEDKQISLFGLPVEIVLAKLNP